MKSVVKKPRFDLYWSKQRFHLPFFFREYSATASALKNSPLYEWKHAKALFDRFEERVQLETSIRTIESQLQSAKSPQSLAELKGMEEVLRRLKYVDENNIVTFKVRQMYSWVYLL